MFAVFAAIRRRFPRGDFFLLDEGKVERGTAAELLRWQASSSGSGTTVVFLIKPAATGSSRSYLSSRCVGWPLSTLTPHNYGMTATVECNATWNVRLLSESTNPRIP